MNLFLLLFSVAIVTYIFTGLIRIFFSNKKFLDIPNERSSHSIPTLRGGGVAFVIINLLIIPFLLYKNLLNLNLALALFFSGGLVALIGFLDDRYSISIRIRIIVHFLASIWSVFWLSQVSSALSIDSNALSYIAYSIAVIYLVWILNLYNFMDGINGIASIEAITTCFSITIIYFLKAPELPNWVIISTLGFSMCGFLFWNFPNAKIFMGDVGSGFLGIIIGMLSIHSFSISSELPWCWLILLGTFIVDANFTLLRRILRGEPFYLPHRSHAYQKLSRILSSHASVTLIYGGINLFWLLPIAIAVVLNWLEGPYGLALAYMPLLFGAYRLKAGIQENRS